MKDKYSEIRKYLKNWARRCHYDLMIVAKDKHSNFMSFLAYLEHLSDYRANEGRTHDDEWVAIRKGISQVKGEDLYKLEKTIRK